MNIHHQQRDYPETVEGKGDKENKQAKPEGRVRDLVRRRNES